MTRLMAERRQTLLRSARETAARLEEPAARQAAAALAILHRSGVEGLRRVLRRDVRVLTGATAVHWQRFATAVRPLLEQIAKDSGQEEAAFFLGWVKRLARVDPGATRQAWPARPGPALPAAGDSVEAELLEERTRRGGWKARDPVSGLTGPIQSSGDIPSTAKPGDRLMLVVASVTPNEMAFRFPRPEAEDRARRGAAARQEQRRRNPPERRPRSR